MENANGVPNWKVDVPLPLVNNGLVKVVTLVVVGAVTKLVGAKGGS